MSVQACAELVRRGDPDRFLAVMAAPPDARGPLFAIYAFNVEIARAPWVTEETMIAEMRLQWWRDALAEIAENRPVRAHEVTTPLARVLTGEAAVVLDRLVQARRWDIYRDPFEDADHFSAYLDQTAGGLTWVAAQATGATEGEAAVRDIAWASGLANWLLAIPELEARGRLPLVDGRETAIRDLAQSGLDRLGRAVAPKPARAALLATWRAGHLLQRAVADPSRVAAGALPGSEFRRRLGLLWRSIAG
jgi:hypothetical protein